MYLSFKPYTNQYGSCACVLQMNLHGMDDPENKVK